MGKRGKVLGVLFAAALVMVGNVNAYAASSANWNVNYLKGAPQQSANIFVLLEKLKLFI